MSDYERLLKGVCEAAEGFVRFHGDDMADARHTLAGFLNRVDRHDPKAAHEIREGITDGQRPDDSHSQPTDDTLGGDFTEEEIAVVRAWCAHLDCSYKDAAEYPFKGIPIWPDGTRLKTWIPMERCKAIAEHLAEKE